MSNRYALMKMLLFQSVFIISNAGNEPAYLADAAPYILNTVSIGARCKAYSDLFCDFKEFGVNPESF